MWQISLPNLFILQRVSDSCNIISFAVKLPKYAERPGKVKAAGCKAGIRLKGFRELALHLEAQMHKSVFTVLKTASLHLAHHGKDRTATKQVKP